MPLPKQTALYYGADPGQPAIVPANDLEIGTGGLILNMQAACS